MLPYTLQSGQASFSISPTTPRPQADQHNGVSGPIISTREGTRCPSRCVAPLITMVSGEARLSADGIRNADR